MQQFIKGVLEEHYDVSVMNNGKEAWDILQKRVIPDLIISDIMMPNMDGFTLIEHIRNEKDLQWTPIIMLTAKTLENDKLKALNLGVDDYLTKPFSVKELKVRVRNLLQNKLAREAWINQEFFKSDPIEKSSSNTILPDNETDKIWLQSVNEKLESLYADAQFDATTLAQNMQLSKRQLERRLKSVTGLSPAKYIQSFRLNKAYAILESGSFDSISNVCYGVGFGSPSHFSRIFIERFGKKPSDFK